jgi:hypothetical protein
MNNRDVKLMTVIKLVFFSKVSLRDYTKTIEITHGKFLSISGAKLMRKRHTTSHVIRLWRFLGERKVGGWASSIL